MAISIEIADGGLKAAAEVVDKPGITQLKTLRQKIDAKIAEDDKRNSREAQRAARLQAAASEAMAPAVIYAKAALARIGLDFHAAADLGKLNAALTEAKLDMTKRIELKKILADLGVID